MIQHTVVFKLKHNARSQEETKFLSDAEVILPSIPGVQNFECLRQVSPKNDYEFGFSMNFQNEEDYMAYNRHPEHTSFVNDRWIPEVEKYLEIDYIKYEISK